MKRLPLFLVLFFILSSLQAQLAIGEFRTHLPYNSFKDVAAGNDYIYAATNNSLMLVDKTNYDLFTWSKVDGLSDVGISKISFSKNDNILIIAYDNSNLDFIRDDQLLNIPDIKNKQIIGKKNINNIFVKDSYAYLSCSFGIVIIDLKELIIADTWFTNSGNEYYEVLDFTVCNGRFYASTSKGIFSIDEDNPSKANFTEWNYESIAGEKAYPIIQTFDNKLFVVLKGASKDTLFRWDNNIWEDISFIPFIVIRSLAVHENELLICDWNHGMIIDPSLDVVETIWWTYGHTNVQNAVFDDYENIWFANHDGGGLAHFNRSSHSSNIYRYPGPATEDVEDIAYSNGTIAIVPGSRNGWGVTNYIPGSVSWLNREDWHYDRESFQETFRNYDYTSIIINPKNNNDFFIAAWRGGLLRYTDGKLNMQYTDQNSPLDMLDSVILISGLCFDRNNNLWITNSQSPYPLKVLMNDGKTWKKFSLGVELRAFAEHVLVDSRDYKWITFPRSTTYQLLVFDDKNNTSHFVNMNSNKVHIQTSTTTCIAEDKDGIIWLGTEQGIKIIVSPGSAFSGGAITENILIEQLGHVEPLLKAEQITAITVDDGNRKWIGTARAGVFLMSPDGKEELLHFTEENSPLLSNQITSIRINDDNGEVFFGTSKGLISYRGEATRGKDNYDEVKVFPNPVREDYLGKVAISGLKDNSFCKIVDSGGHLVYQGYAYGGQFIWNGKNMQGKRPATGVYFVFASDEKGKTKKVAKFLFIN